MAERRDPLLECTGFHWDDGNAEKTWERHRVAPEEAKEIFFNEPLIVRGDIGHSVHEKRFYALGQSSRGRFLFAAFTIRRDLIRVISVRDMNRREKEAYGKHEDEKAE